MTGPVGMPNVTPAMTPEQWVGQAPLQTLTYEAACDCCGSPALWTGVHGSSLLRVDCVECAAEGAA